jgi:hypothetical protein
LTPNEKPSTTEDWENLILGAVLTTAAFFCVALVGTP